MFLPEVSPVDVGVAVYGFVATGGAWRAIRQRNELQKLADHDPLTGLYTRRIFTEILGREIGRVSRYGYPCSIFILDIDNFKSINDTYGHPVGDAALRALARETETHTRATDVPARLGGEEFGLIMPDTDEDGALYSAQKLRAGIANLALPTEKGTLDFTASFGLTSIRPSDSPESVYARADQALYTAKAQGKNRVVVAP